MEKWKKRSVDLIASIALGSKSGTPSVVPYYPQKTDTSSYEKRSLNRSIPERHGISSKRIYNMLCELESERRANIHNLIIIKDGEVISECSRDGYDVNTFHLSHSMSKTVTGMAIGMLVDDGLLNTETRLVELFPEVPYKDKRFANITVEHLLSMTSGVPFSEVGTVTELDWTVTFFSSQLKFAPGTQFDYNSMNSYILAKIVTRISGRSLTEFLDERLFAPLEIRNYFWEIGPEGVEKGGWGLYLSAESWAKIGLMMLSYGAYAGRRILSVDWVERSCEAHATAPEINGDFNYGYQLWVGRNSEEVLFNGMLGQNVWLCPRNNLVAVILCGNNELFQMSPAMDIIRKYLGCDINDSLYRRDIKVLHERETRFFDTRRWVRPLEKKQGFMYWLGLRSRTIYDERWNDLLGEYRFGHNNVGLLPLFVRAMQNNLASRIERVLFERYGDGIFMTVTESGEDYRMEVGLYDYRQSTLDFRGEKYTVKVIGEACINVSGEEEYRIEILFPELPNTRMLKFTMPMKDRIYLEFSEAPNNRIVDALLERASAVSPALGFAVDLLERRFGEGFIEKRVEETFTPILVGADMAYDNAEAIIESENLRAAEESRIVKLIRSVVDMFFKEGGRDNEKEPVEQGRPKAFLGGIFDRIKSGKKE